MTRSQIRNLLRSSFVFVTVAVTVSFMSAAQNPPDGRGTMALEGTMKKFYRAANVIIVSTMDGVEHIYHFTNDVIVHGGKGAGVDALEGLREGSMVVVHYQGEAKEPGLGEVDIIGDQGLEVTEGRVTTIDRRRGQITLRYDNGKTEVFQLTPHAAEEAQGAAGAAPSGTKVVVYYTDEHGQKVAHFFRRVSK